MELLSDTVAVRSTGFVKMIFCRPSVASALVRSASVPVETAWGTDTTMAVVEVAPMDLSVLPSFAISTLFGPTDTMPSGRSATWTVAPASLPESVEQPPSPRMSRSAAPHLAMNLIMPA